MTNSVDGCSAVQWSRRELTGRAPALPWPGQRGYGGPESFLKVVPPKGAAKTGVKKHRCVLIGVFLCPPSAPFRVSRSVKIFLLLGLS